MTRVIRDEFGDALDVIKIYIKCYLNVPILPPIPLTLVYMIQ